MELYSTIRTECKFAYCRDESQGADNWSNAISALALNCDHSRLLVGNSRGNILEYDMKDGKLLRTLNDVHPPDAGILHLKVVTYIILLKINGIY